MSLEQKIDGNITNFYIYFIYTKVEIVISETKILYTIKSLNDTAMVF